MQVATKSTLGAGLMLVPLVFLAAYHVREIGKQTEVNQDLAHYEFPVALTCLELLRQVELMREYADKYSATEDAGYRTKLRESRDAFTRELRSLSDAAHVGVLGPAIANLNQEWSALAPADGAPSQAFWSASAREQMLRLRSAVQEVYAAARAVIAKRVGSAEAAKQAAERLSWSVVGVALLLGGVVAFFVTRSMNRPLKQITEATRSVSQGQFDLRLAVSQKDEFGALARAFNTMVRRLAELDELKKGFVSHVSHELRSPLVAMQETNRLLQEGIPGKLNPEQHRMVELNLDGARRLESMIGKLLGLSRLEANATFDLEPRDLVALVRAAVETFENRMAEKQLDPSLQLPPHPVRLPCDGDGMLQVVHNLLENAVKFTSPGTTVSVAIEETVVGPPARGVSARHPEDGVLLTVSDRGPGIQDADKDAVFEKFFQVQRGRRRTGRGVGLGLAICREIVEAHRGRIWVEDVLPSGSAFRVWLPRAVG